MDPATLQREFSVLPFAFMATAYCLTEIAGTRPVRRRVLVLYLLLVLIAAVILHIIAAYQLTMQNRAARPIDYVNRESQVSTWAARTMRWGGVILLVFIVLHIMHFTNPGWRPEGVFDKAVAMIKEGKRLGYYVCTNTTVYREVTRSRDGADLEP